MSLLKVSTSSGAYGYGRDILMASSVSVTWALTSTGDGLSGGQTTLTATAYGGGGATAPVGGVGVATRIAWWSDTSTLSSSANLYWDNSNAFLGVGGTPSYNLHVVSPAGTNATMWLQPTTVDKLAWLQIHNSRNDIIIGVEGGAAGALFVGDAAGAAAFGTVGVMFIAAGNRCRISVIDSGMVGIGPVAPTVDVAALYVRHYAGYGLNGGGVGPALEVDDAAHPALTASTERNSVLYDLSQTIQWATGALTTQRAFLVKAPTYGFVAASVLSDAATVAIDKAPVQGSNATITRAWSLWVQTNYSRFGAPVFFDASVTVPTANTAGGWLGVGTMANTQKVLAYVDGAGYVHPVSPCAMNTRLQRAQFC